MPRMLGDAFVVINPDTRNFRASADRQIKQALAGLKYEVPLGIDAAGTLGAIRLLQQRIRQQGLADFLDVNIPVGKLVAQVQLIKRLLNQAHVADALEVNLDQASLQRQLRILKTAASSVTANVPVTFDVSQMPALEPIAPLLEKVKVGWAVPPLKPLADEAARGVHETIDISWDIGKMPALGPIGNLSEKPVIDTAAANAALAALAKTAANDNAMFAIFNGTAMRTSLESIAMARSLAGANNALAVMSGDAARAATAVLADQAAVARMASSARDATSVMQNMAAATAIMDGSAMRFAAATVAMTGGGGGGGGLLGMAAALHGASAAFGTGTMWTGRWNGALAATIPIIGMTVKSMAGWHIILDLIIEGLIAVGLAAAAMATGLAAAAPAAHNLFDWLQSVHTVSTALGRVVTPMTGQFQALSKAMAPQVIEAFGGALSAVTSKTGGLAQVAGRVVTMFDDWIAKIDLWAASQGGFTKLLQSGIGYLAQFAGIIGNVVKAIAMLLTKDPGIARFLLDFIAGVSKLLLMFASLPAPIVTAVLALHGFYLWGSVLLPLVLRLTGYLLGLGAAFLELVANPFFWVAAAVAGLALLAWQSTQATKSAKEFTAAIDAGLANDTATQAILAIAAAVGQLTVQIQANTGPINAMKQWNAQSESLGGGFQRLSFNMRATGAAFGKAFGDIPQMLSSWGALGRTVRDFGHAIADVFSSNSGASIAAGNNIKLYEDKIRSLIVQQGILFRVAGELVSGNNSVSKSAYTLAQAFAIEDLAGVKAGDHFDLANQKVRNLLAGYKAMSIQGPLLASSVDAVTFATLQQDSKVATLTGAWTTFISLVTGGLSAFSTFQQQIATITGDLSGVAPAAIKGGTALGGLSAASLQANLAFTQGVTDANLLVNALTLQVSASGLAQRGTDMLAAATKDAVAQMIPMAGHSVAAQAALISLAQQGGFPAGESFRQLQKWVGTASGTMGSAAKAGGPATQLNAIMATLARTSENLTADVKNLSVALGQQLSGAEAQAILLARGGVKPFQDLANAIARTGVDSGATYKAAVTLGDEFLALSRNNVPAAKAQFEAFAIGGLGLTKAQADALWKDVLGNGVPALNQAGAKAASAEAAFVAFAKTGLNVTTADAQLLWKMFSQQNLDVMATKAGGAKAAFIQLAMNGLHLTTNQAQQLWDMFRQQKLDEAAAKAGETRAQFEHLAGELGLTKQAADRLWASLHAIAAGSPYNVKVHEDGTGLFTITGPGILKSQGAGGSGNAGGGLAAGGVIKMGSGPTADDVHVMVSKGETVVSAADSKRLAPAFAAVGVPGYRQGGIIPGGDTGSLARSTIDFHNSFARTMTDTLKADMTRAMIAARAAAIAAMGGSGGNIVKFAESFLGKIPYVWGGTSLSSAGADCSGFTQAVYGHFGIHAPRTSEAQGGWVKRTPPEAGGLAFYHSPPGGPDPGHVAIVADPVTVISQGGGMGPVLQSLRFLPLLWTGIPPGGFPGGGGGPTPGGVMSALAIEQLWDQLGGRPSAAGNMARIAFAESGDNPGAVQAGQPPGLTGWGLYQITPTSGISQNGAFGNLLNASNNTRAAISLYNASGYLPWASDPVASALIAAGITYAAGGRPGSRNERSTPQGFAAGGFMPPARLPKPRGPADPMAAARTSILAAIALRGRLAGEQAREGEDYTGLRQAFFRGPRGDLNAQTLRAIHQLSLTQGAEQVAYKALLGPRGLTAANLGSLSGAARAEMTTLRQAPVLARHPGGHPGWVHGLQYWLGQLAGTGKSRAPLTLEGVAALFEATRGHGTFTVSAGPGAEWQYGTGLTGTLVPQSFDQGGYLQPGMNLAWNGTGRPEPVGVGGTCTVQLEITGSGSGTFDAFLLKWLKNNVRVRGGGSVQRAWGNHEITR